MAGSLTEVRPRPRSSSSVVIGWCLILSSGLAVMASLAQRTPVAAVPEESLVASVGNDVVHHRSLHVLALLHALDAQRVRTEKLPAGFLPCSCVSTAGSGPNFLRVHRLVDLTVLGPGGNQRRAAWVLAWYLWFHRHGLTSQETV